MTPTSVARRRALLAAGCACALPPCVWAQDAAAAALRVALLPYLPPRALLQTWEPLRLHLMKQLGQPVEMYSAANFRALVDSVRKRAQELTLVPVHIGQLLAEEGSALWLAMSTRRAAVLLLTALPADAGWAGRRFGVSDPLSVLALTARRWLAAQQLSSRVTVMEAPSPATLALWLARGDVDAILVSSSQIPDLAPLREVAGLRAVTLDWVLTPGWQVLPGTPPARSQQLQSALLAYRAPEDRGTAATSVWERPDPKLLAAYDDLARDAAALLGARR